MINRATLIRFRELVPKAALFMGGALICGNMIACASDQIRPRPQDLVPINENFFSKIVWFDEAALPNLDFMSTCESGSKTGFSIDRTLELTALSFYDKDPALFPSAGGYPLEGVSGSVSGCPPTTIKKKSSENHRR